MEQRDLDEKQKVLEELRLQARKLEEKARDEQERRLHERKIIEDAGRKEFEKLSIPSVWRTDRQSPESRSEQGTKHQEVTKEISHRHIEGDTRSALRHHFRRVQVSTDVLDRVGFIDELLKYDLSPAKLLILLDSANSSVKELILKLLKAICDKLDVHTQVETPKPTSSNDSIKRMEWELQEKYWEKELRDALRRDHTLYKLLEESARRREEEKRKKKKKEDAYHGSGWIH